MNESPIRLYTAPNGSVKSVLIEIRFGPNPFDTYTYAVAMGAEYWDEAAARKELARRVAHSIVTDDWSADDGLSE